MKRDGTQTVNAHTSQTPTRRANGKLTSKGRIPLSYLWVCHRKQIRGVNMVPDRWYLLMLDDITCSTSMIMRLRQCGDNLSSFSHNVFV